MSEVTTAYLTEEPQHLTAELEVMLRTCPRPVHLGPDRTVFATCQQREELSQLLQSHLLTHEEYMWVLFMRVYFSATWADKVNRLLTSITEHRRAHTPAGLPYDPRLGRPGKRYL
ncbi:hypothetical protein [Hymenobacter mucosus]|uniref:Uncharacterized protein n=1 Tax=Hymenobacter mucosus TaxID=1411120 RepID=A0A238X4P8_9BACT|nr:hypothetical protein [Hymenobacter mucosus]SNR52829.1 hypothetical protein SAMN06269173_103391 [Hymenobacter mucosus]